MIKSFSILACAAIVIACHDDDKVSKTQLLTDGTSKSWNITATSPEPDEESCRPDADHARDNAWTFSNDGSFVYDHGTLTEGEVCSDARNLTGLWKFTENEANLLITVLYETGNPGNTFDGDTLVLAKIEAITAEILMLNIDDEIATLTPN
jgi:hypothetical protein